MNQNSVDEKSEEEIYLAKKLMDSINNGSTDQLHELFKIAHLNPQVFIHCEKYFQKGIELDIDKYECMNDYGLIQMLKGNDPIEYFKKSYEEGKSENGLFNFAVFTKDKDLLKESADKYENSMSMLLYYQMSKDINYLQKSAIQYKNPFALVLYGLYKIESESNENAENKNKKIKDNENNKTNDNENNKVNDNEKNKADDNENDGNENKEEEKNDESENKVDNDDEKIEEEEEISDDVFNDGQQLLTEAAILTKPGDKYNLLPFPSVLFYNKEFVNECKNNIKRAADLGNPHCAYLYAYMSNDLQEKAKYYKFAGDKGLADGYFHYYKLVRKNNSLFSPGEFDTFSPQKEESKDQNSAKETKEVAPSNFEFEMKRFVGEMDGYIDFQKSIFDITINNVPTVSQNIVSTIVDVKSVYKLVHNIILAVDYRPFEQNLNALANLATSIHFLIFDEYLQNLFRDLLIQETCSNTSRNRSRFYFIELCIENFMFSMDYFCKAVSYIKEFRQNVNYNRYVELWFPEVRKFIIKNERENQNQNISENENEEEETENENEVEEKIESKNEIESENKENEKEESNNENEKVENKDETESENKVDEKVENKDETESENKVDEKVENKDETESENKVDEKVENKDETESENKVDEKAENKTENETVNKEDDDDYIDLNYFFDTKKHIDDTKHNSNQTKSNEEADNENIFNFLPFRDTTLVSASFIKAHRKEGNPDPLSQAIRHDDITKFKRLLMQGKKTNINTRIQPSFFELSSMLDKRPSLLCYCAFFNAEKCFNFLIENEADTLVFDDECLTVSAYAAASGSTKILARLEAVNELEHQEAAEFASRFHRGRILKRLMNGKTMCGAAAEEMKENQKSIANELLERQKRQMMQELQIRRILIQQQKFIQQQELINQRNMKLQQEEQKLKLERFLIQQQQKIKLQQEQQKKQQQQKSTENPTELSNQSENIEKENISKETNENAIQSTSTTPITSNEAQPAPTANSETHQSNNLTETKPNSEIKQQSNNSTESNKQSEINSNSEIKQQSNNSTESNKQSEINSNSEIKQQSNNLTESNSEKQTPQSSNSPSENQVLTGPTETSSSNSNSTTKRSSFFGKYADLQKQVLLEQRKQQLLKQQQQDQLRNQALQKAAESRAQNQGQDLNLPPALSRLVASQTQQNQEANFGTFHRRPNPYKQEPIEERHEEFIVRDGESKVEEIEKIVVNGLLSDFVESLNYFDASSKSNQDKTKANKKSNKSNENEEEEEEEESEDDEEEEVDETEDGLLPLFSEDLNGENSSSSIFYKICELGNSGVVHFFNRDIWKRMLIETVHGEGRETVLTRLAAIGNYDMLDEILKIKEVKKLINVANLQGNTPIEVATVNKHQNIVDIFESFLDEE